MPTGFLLAPHAHKGNRTVENSVEMRKDMPEYLSSDLSSLSLFENIILDGM